MMKRKMALIIAAVMVMLSFSGCTKIIQKIDDPISVTEFSDIVKELDLESEMLTENDEMKVYEASDEEISITYYEYKDISNVNSGYKYIEQYLKGIFTEEQYSIDEEERFSAQNDTQKVYLLVDENVIMYMFSISNDYNDRLDKAADKLKF